MLSSQIHDLDDASWFQIRVEIYWKFKYLQQVRKHIVAKSVEKFCLTKTVDKRLTRFLRSISSKSGRFYKFIKKRFIRLYKSQWNAISAINSGLNFRLKIRSLNSCRVPDFLLGVLLAHGISFFFEFCIKCAFLLKSRLLPTLDPVFSSRPFPLADFMITISHIIYCLKCHH